MKPLIWLVAMIAALTLGCSCGDDNDDDDGGDSVQFGSCDARAIECIETYDDPYAEPECWDACVDGCWESYDNCAAYYDAMLSDCLDRCVSPLGSIDTECQDECQSDWLRDGGLHCDSSELCSGSS